MTGHHLLYDWNGLNVALFLALNRPAGEAQAALATLGNIVGNYWGMPLLVAVLLLWAGNQMHRANYDSAAQLRLQVRRLIIAFIIASASVAMLKFGFDFPRPAIVLGAQAHLSGTPHDRYSFPSGHTAYATLVAAICWPLVRPVLRPLLLAFVVWVAWSRVGTGAHFPVDVVAGSLVGLLSGRLAYRVVRPLPGEGNPVSRHIAFERVLAKAQLSYRAGDYTHAMGLLQDAHVIGQGLWWPHLRSHLWMLRIATVRRDWHEIRGQMLRIVLVPIGNATGRLPLGNTGDAKVNAFTPMPLPQRLQTILEKHYE